MVLAMAGADTGGAGHPWAAGRGQMLRLLEQQSVVMVSPRPEAARAIGWTPAGLVALGPPLLGKGRMLVRMPPDSLPRHSTQSESWGTVHAATGELMTCQCHDFHRCLFLQSRGSPRGDS